MGSNPISGTIYGSVVELVYAPASSTGIERYEGSSPSTATKQITPQGVGKDERIEGLQWKGVLLNGFEGILAS